MTKPTPLSTFRISEENLAVDTTVTQAYDDYCDKREAFGEAVKALKEATESLHAALDAPLRTSGAVPEGKDWTLKEDDDDGLLIHVWSESRQRWRRKPEVPLRQLSFRSQIKGPRAA